MAVIDATDGTFAAEIANHKGLVLADFWAVWCGPCKMIEPMLKKLSDQYAGALKVVKVDVEKNPDTVEKYEVRNTPTLALLKDGEKIDQIVGAATFKQLTDWIDVKLDPNA